MSYPSFLNELLERLLALAPAPSGTAFERPAALAFSKPPKPELGDLSLAVFPFAKQAQMPPAKLASDWCDAVQREISAGGGRLSGLPIGVARVAPAGPYVNLTLEASDFARFVLAEVAARGADYGAAEAKSGEKVMVEYSAPNTNKPLHLGHLRNNLLGMSLANLLERAGHDVIKVNLVNDRGIHICKSMLAYQRFGNGETPASTGEKPDHFVGRYYVLFDTKLKEERRAHAEAAGVDLTRFSKEALAAAGKEGEKALTAELERFDAAFERQSALMEGARDLLRRWEANDPETRALWRTMNDWVYEGFRVTYERLGCKFDHWYYESEVWMLGKAQVERGLSRGVFYAQPDGSVWARLEPVGLQDRVVLRSDGTTVYITQDLGTAVKKFEDYHCDRSIYVVGAEQDQHFKNLFAMLRLLGYDWAERCHHASYGLVTLPRGMGKLKSREGKAVDADDLLDDLHAMARERIQEGGHHSSSGDAERTAEEIGQGAIKLYLLQVSAEKSIQFDPNETIAFTGDTGPAVQYSHARICGILRKGLEAGAIAEGDLVPADATRGNGSFLRAERVEAGRLVEAEEREVLRQLSDYPQVLAQAARQLSPAPVANYLLELTKAYARMYHEHEVLKAADPALLRGRLQLSLAVAQVLKNGLALLSIAAPERM